MDESEYREELSFAKIGENKSHFKFPDDYVLFHQTFNSRFIVNPGKILVGINYDKLCGYLEGASVGKSTNQIFLFNGISNSTRNGWYPNVEFLRLDKSELEKLMDDSGISGRFDHLLKK